MHHLEPYQWKPGQSGNPGGRPKGRSLTAILRELLDATEVDGLHIADGKRIGDLVTEAILRRCLDGDVSMIRELLNRIDGRVPPADPYGSSKTTLADAIAEAEAALTDTETPETTNEPCDESDSQP